MEEVRHSSMEEVRMAKRKALSLESWFGNCGSWRPNHDLGELQRGIEAGMLNEQDEYGMTALTLAVTSDWKAGVEALLHAKADTELRYFRTGATALHMALQQRNESIALMLVAGEANPDAANHWGLTPRATVPFTIGISTVFDHVPLSKVQLLVTRIQNAEHLAEHFHPRFKIPDREERETLQIGQAVDLYVYGPKAETKQDTVKIRITARSGRRPKVQYTATVETPIEQTHLAEGTTVVEFRPENVASVYVPRPGKK